MHTARLETVRAVVSVATMSLRGGGGGAVGRQMNKFEQVSIDHGQIPLVQGGGGLGPQV